LHALQYFHNLFRKKARKKKSVPKVGGDQIACKVGKTHPMGPTGWLHLWL